MMVYTTYSISKACTYNVSIELLCSVVIVVLVSSPVAQVGQETSEEISTLTHYPPVAPVGQETSVEISTITHYPTEAMWDRTPL